MQHLDEGSLQAWLDRPRSGMSSEESIQVERHLEACDECASALENLTTLDARAGEILGHAEPGDVVIPDFASVLERTSHRKATEGRTGSRASETRLRSLAWAASLVLALGAGWVARDLYRSGASGGTADVALAPQAGARAQTESVEASAAPSDEVRGSAEPMADESVVRARIAEEEPVESSDQPVSEAFADAANTVAEATPSPAPNVAAAERAQLDALALEDVVATASPGALERGPTPNTDAAPLAAGSAGRADDPELDGRFLLLTNLEVVEIEVLGTGEGIRIVQALDDSARLVMVQSVGGPPDGLGDVADGQPIQTVEVDGLYVVGTAPISADSLGALLEGLGR